MPDVPAGAAAPDADTQQLLAQVVDALNDQVRRSPSGVGEILADYLHDLQTDPDGVRDTLQAYTVVLAATCQHAAPDYQPMARARGEHSGRPSDLVFDTVVVDEAARANPLDLFIPMARASRRIVLVGDHRQLPHILEPGIEKELEKTVLAQTRENLRRSLFERLFAQLRDWEKRDDIRRTVTLDTQYRMHPELGAFVSRTFYEQHGEPKIKAGRPAAAFTHDLPGYLGRVAQWVDVPNEGGNGEVGRKTKARPAEARWIARELKRLAEHSPHLSFGVITFYSAQVTALWRELSAPDVGIAEELDQGGFEVAPGWRERRDQQGHLIEHIRVGTVDAFQGMEFDVVFLSVTRSNTISPTDEMRRRQKYGHLMLENRVCVAMSRQKRLLIVVGDRAMIEGDVAADALRPLVQFHRDLCGGTHVVAH